MNSNSNLDSFGLSLFDLEIEKREKIEIEKEPKPCQPTNTQSPAQENPAKTFFPGPTPLPSPARGPAQPAPALPLSWAAPPACHQSRNGPARHTDRSPRLGPAGPRSARSLATASPSPTTRLTPPASARSPAPRAQRPVRVAFPRCQAGPAGQGHPLPRTARTQ